VLNGQNEGTFRLEDPVDRTQHPAEVLDVVEGGGAEHELDRLGGDERQLAQVALVEVDVGAGAGGQGARRRQLFAGRVDGDDPGAQPGEGHGRLPRPAAEVEDPLARQHAGDDAELPVGRQPRAERDVALDRRRVLPLVAARRPIPRLDVAVTHGATLLPQPRPPDWGGGGGMPGGQGPAAIKVV
jgi:hypothetical protein